MKEKEVAKVEVEKEPDERTTTEQVENPFNLNAPEMPSTLEEVVSYPVRLFACYGYQSLRKDGRVLL